MRMLARYLHRDESGQNLVEIAVTLPILLLLMLGGGELARLAYASIEVMNAASAAVQYGDQNSGFAMDDAGMLAAAQEDAANLPGQLSESSSRQYQCSNAVGTYITVTNTSCTGAQIEEILTVNTSATLDLVIHCPGLPKTFTVTGQAKQLVLQ